MNSTPDSAPALFMSGVVFLATDAPSTALDVWTRMRGISLSEIARRSGVHHNTARRIVGGGKFNSTGAYRVALALHLPFGVLMDGSKKTSWEFVVEGGVCVEVR